MHFFQAAAVKLHRVSPDCEDDVIAVHFIILGHLDRHQSVGDAGESQKIKIIYEILRNTLFNQVFAANRFVE